MPMLRYQIFKTICSCLLVLFFLPFKSDAIDVDIGKVQDAVREAVEGSPANIEVVLQGSHVTGKNFVSPLKGGTSDFDMRLAFKNNVSEAEAIQEWKAFRERLKRALKNKYPDQADFMKILESTNVYPPEQLMQGVTGRSDALNRFKSMNTVPNLLHDSADSLNDKTFKDLAGGLYGETAEKATRQSFEKNVGKVISRDSTGKVREFLADLTHRAEGEGIYTVRGAGNAASQWIDDAINAVKSGNYKNIAKNVERATILLKGKDLARLPLSKNDLALKNAADEMASILKEFGDNALDEAARSAFAERVGAVISKYNLLEVLKEAKMDAECMRLGDSKFARLVAAGLLERSGKWAVLAEQFKKLWSHIPEGTFPAALNALVMTFEISTASEKAAEDGFEKAAASLGINIAGIYSGPIGWSQLASSITVAVLDIATDYMKDRAYEFAAGFQKCSDLIAGVYTVKGRETQHVDTSSLTTCHKVEDIRALACNTADMDAVIKLVECHAGNAARRFEGGGAGEKETEQGIISALTRKCGMDGKKPGAVVYEWLIERELLKREFDDLLRSFDSAPLYVETMPSSAEASEGAPVTVRMKAEIEGFDEKRFLSYLQCFGGEVSKPFVFTDYKWGVNGVLKEEKTVPSVELDFEPGDYMIDVAVEIRYINRSAGIDKYLSKGANLPFVVGKKAGKIAQDGKDKETERDSADGESAKDGEKKTALTVQVQPDSYTKGFGAQDANDVPHEGGGQPPSDEKISAKGPVHTPDAGKTGTVPDFKDEIEIKGETEGKVAAGDDKKTPGEQKTEDKDKKADGRKTDVKEPPICSYEYTDWGECSRETKKQTRGVVSTKPEGCLEKDKPVLEQGCTPPPTEEEKRLSFLNCLCRSCGGSMGGYYNTGDGCGNARPCACQGVFNCWSTPVPTGAELIKSCYASAYGVKDPSDKDLRTALNGIKEENRKHMTPLKATLSPEGCPKHAQLGDVINFSVSIEGGIGPHQVAWSGDGEAKDRNFTFAKTRQPGSFPISATVSDSDGNTATVSCTVIVDAITVTIEKTSPAENTLPVGSQASFRATVKSGSGQAGGELKFQWQPHPEVKFGDDKKPLFETTSPNTTATYTRRGTFQMWVTVLKKLGEAYQTVGESERIPIEVVNPKLKLTVDKREPVVGETVVITVHEEPKMSDDMIGFWWEIKGNAENPGPAANIPNSRAYSFRPKDTKPVTVTVHAKTKDGKDDLGEEKATVTAKSYNVTVTGPKAAGPKPQIWKEGVGLVEADKEIAVHQRVEFGAEVTPKPGTDLRYSWTVSSGSCTLSNPITKDVGVTCSETGSYEMTVTVKDKDNIELGKGAGNLSVTISQDQLDKAAAKAKPVEVTIEGLQNEVVYGAKLNLSAKPGDRLIAWKSEPAINFTPQQGIGGKTTASFGSIGKVKIWAVAQQKTGEVLGESDKKEINVVAPKFEITFTPPKGKVGEEVKAIIKTTPPIDKSLLKFIWISPQPPNVKTYDANTIGYTPKSTVPVEFLALAKEPVGNVTLAEITGRYTAEAVKLDVSAKPFHDRSADTKSTDAKTSDAKSTDTKSAYANTKSAGAKSAAKSVDKGPVKTAPVPESSKTSRIPDSPGSRHDVTKDPSFKASKKPTGAAEAYDPTKDPGYGAGKPVDIAAVGKAAKEFEEKSWGTKKTEEKAGTSEVTIQSETYTDSRGKKQGDEKVENPPRTPYPPYPPDDTGPGGRDWTGFTKGTGGKDWGKGKTSGKDAGGPATSTTKTTSSSGASSSSSGPTTTGAKTTSSSALLTAVYENKSDANVHIFAEGENFSPGNRLAPGEKRTVSLKIPPDGRIKFISGRNGEVISSKYWNGDPGDLNRYPMVRFVKGMGGKEELSITTNMK